MRKVLNEEIRRIHELMNLHEGQYDNFLFLKRRVPLDVESELFSDAISQASNLLRSKKNKLVQYNLDKFKNMVVSIMFDSFFNGFVTRGEDFPPELETGEIWDFLLQVFSDEIEARYYEIVKELKN